MGLPDLMVTPQRSLVAKDVSVTLRGVSLLKPTAVRVGPRDSLAVVGPSGSGKTTLLRCLSGILTPTTGSVVVGDVELSALSERERSDFRLRSIGIVTQEPALLDELDVADNAAIGLILLGESRKAARSLAVEMLNRLGVGQRTTARPGELSGGEAQRVSMARALLKRAPLAVVADEPTAALDAGNARLVTDELVAVCREHDAPLVIATHDMAVAERCGAVLALR